MRTKTKMRTKVRVRRAMLTATTSRAWKGGDIETLKIEMDEVCGA